MPCGNIPPEGFTGPLTPDQYPCDQCQLLHLVRHVIDFLMIVATPILATLFFLYAGLLLMIGGTNPGMLSQGKSIFKNTFIGLLIVMLAWLGVNILLKTLANYDIIKIKTGISNLQWYEFTCPEGGFFGGGGGGGSGQPTPYCDVNGECVGGPNGGNFCQYDSDCGNVIVVSGERAINLASSGATITWITNMSGTSQVRYGPVYGGNCSTMLYTPTDNNLTTSHSVDLPRLGSGATFCFNVVSKDSSGYEAVGSIFQFKTLP